MDFIQISGVETAFPGGFSQSFVTMRRSSLVPFSTRSRLHANLARSESRSMRLETTDRGENERKIQNLGQSGDRYMVANSISPSKKMLSRYSEEYELPIILQHSRNTGGFAPHTPSTQCMHNGLLNDRACHSVAVIPSSEKHSTYLIPRHPSLNSPALTILSTMDEKMKDNPAGRSDSDSFLHTIEESIVLHKYEVCCLSSTISDLN